MSPEIVAQISMAIISALFIVIAFFLKALIHKIDNAAVAINSLDKNLAIITERMKSSESEIVHINRTNDNVEMEIKNIRERLHKFSNQLHEIFIKQEVMNSN